MHIGRHKENQQMTSRIMLVDDDAALRLTLQAILIDEGWDVVSAKDGFQAIQLASESQFALILMDFKMPGMNGVEALLKIKGILPNCVEVMMTGHAEEHQIEEALSNGVMTVLSKPVEIEKLLEIVDSVVPGKKIPS